MNTKKMTLSAIFTALICIGAFLRIPIPVVPFTLQTLFVVLSGMLLGWKYGMLSVAVYVALGLAGLPVFTSGGGLGYILHPTFGFLLGFLPASAISGLVTGRLHHRLSPYIGGLAGVVCMYLVALPYLYLILTCVMEISITVPALFTSYCFIFLPGDIISVCIASILYRRLSHLVKH